MTTSFTVRISLALLAILVAQVIDRGFAGQKVWAQVRTSPITVQTTTAQTTFHCIPMGGNAYATVAQRGTRQTPPMIIWTSTLGEFGQYTPQRRCEIVSDKFTRAVALNSGKLDGLLLTYGINNRQRAICYVNNLNGACNSDNQLFTLRPADWGRERQILEQLVNFGIHGTGTPVQQSGEIFYANLGEAIDRSFSNPGSQEPATNVNLEGPI
jgi:hypothetical protein